MVPSGKTVRVEAVSPEDQTATLARRLGDIDLDQIEMRLAAHFTADPVMLEAIRKGWDLHGFTAARVNPKVRAWLVFDSGRVCIPCCGGRAEMLWPFDWWGCTVCKNIYAFAVEE